MSTSSVIQLVFAILFMFVGIRHLVVYSETRNLMSGTLALLLMYISYDLWNKGWPL